MNGHPYNLSFETLVSLVPPRLRKNFAGHGRMSGSGNPLVVRSPIGRLEPYGLNVNTLLKPRLLSRVKFIFL